MFILIWTVPIDDIALGGEHKLLALGKRLDNKLHLNNSQAAFRKYGFLLTSKNILNSLTLPVILQCSNAFNFS